MMSESLWSFDQLARFTRYEDPEVRYWAAERLATLFPDEAADVIADLLLDDHDATPELVAEQLGLHGGPHHVPILLKGFRKATGLTPARCLEALARLGYDGAPAVAEIALHQRDFSEPSLGIMVAALAELSVKKKSPEAAERAREFLLRRPELFAEPAALRGAMMLFAPADFGELVLKWITALHFRGLEQVDSCIRVLLEELQLEDCGWCVRTERSGRIDLERTLKAIESGFDIDVRGQIPADRLAEIAERLRGGEFSAIAASLGSFIQTRAAHIHGDPEDTLPVRLEALGRAFQSPELLEIADRLETAMHQWLIGILISAVVKVATYRNYLIELQTAGSDLEALLSLAGMETSCLLNSVPAKIAAAAGQAAPERRTTALDWCVRTLEARGPFFPKAVALDTLGAMQADELVPEIARHLVDDNAYIYGAAERALARIGAPVIEHSRVALERGGTHPDALQSLLRLSCELTRTDSLSLMLEHFDEIFESIGPEAGAEAAGILGHQDLVPHLRRWLNRSPAMVGHALLLIGAINNVPIPEEESILKAIDDYWKGATDGAEGTGNPSGQYLM
jgi:HEAT repeat protein